MTATAPPQQAPQEASQGGRPASFSEGPGGSAGALDGATRRNVSTATFWAAVETAGAQGSAFLFFVVFARLLSPHEFGVYALGMAIVGAVNMILFQGFGDGLIQAQRVDDEATSTAFWTNMMLAAAMVAGLQVAARFAQGWFNEPMLGPVIAWLSLLCFPRALVSVHSALYRRSLDLRIFAIRTVTGSLVGGLAGVALALDGFGVWALVISQFIQSALVAAIMWRSTAWRPRFLFSGTAFRSLFEFSRHFMAASVISSCIDDLASVVVGLNMDFTAVGYFSVALRVLRAAITVVMTPLQLVMMPALSRIAHLGDRFGAAYSDMVLLTATIWLPLTAGLGLAAPMVIPLVFGAQWLGAVAVIQAMCFVGLTMPLWTFSGQALSALGRPDAFAGMAYWQLGLYCAAFPLAVHGGIVAVGWTWAGLSAVMVPISLTRLHRLSGLDVGRLLAGATRIALGGCAMLAAALAVQGTLPTGPWTLVGEEVAGLAAYTAALALLLPGHLTRLCALARGTLPVMALRRKQVQ